MTRRPSSTSALARWLPGDVPIVTTDVDREAPSGPERVASSDGARVLVVDDNADMRAYLRSLLEKRWTVETAESGQAALARLADRTPDLVLTDVMMAGLDGFGLLSAIRADDRWRHLPVMVLSARAGEEARVEGLRAGADDYLVKPFSGRELLARIDANLRFAESARERADLLAREQAARRGADVQREDLYAVFTLAPTPIAILRGRAFVIELANPSACAIWGRPAVAVVGRPMLEAVPEMATPAFIELLNGVLDSGRPYSGTEAPVELARGADGAVETVYLNFVYTPAPLCLGRGRRGARGRVGGDRPGEGPAEISWACANRPSPRRPHRAKDEFLAMLGHELRNPLAPILTALQLMNLRDVGVVERERAVIERQVNHLVALVDDLLDVSRITRGKIYLRREPTELSDLVSRAIEMASPLLEHQRHALHLDVAPTGLTVDGDHEAARPGARQPHHERRQVHRGGRPDRDPGPG